MKKKLALLMASVMVVGALPMTAFAATDNSISRIKTVEDEDAFEAVLVMEEFDANTTQAIKLTLTNAEWQNSGDWDEFTRISDTKAFAEFKTDADGTYKLTLPVEADGEGEATVTIEDVDSTVTEETLKIANIVDGSTITTIEDTTSLKEGSTKIDPITIEEVTAGAIDEDAKIKFRLSSDFEWDEDEEPTVKFYPTDCGLSVNKITFDERDMYIQLEGESDTAATISVVGAYVKYDSDDVDYGTECEVTISDDGVTKTTLVVGTAADYDITLSVEDDDLPVLPAGRSKDTETLAIKIKENIAGSWLNNRKAKLTFPEGVEVVKINKETCKNVEEDWDDIFDIDENEVNISATANGSGKLELEMTFELSISPEFTGDIDVTLSGSAVGEDQTQTIATAVFPVTVEAEINELSIDYRETSASDIIITEVAAGTLKKGKEVILKLDEIDFDGDPTVEVEEGDLKIKDVKVDDGEIRFTIKSESQKEAGVIRISDIALYMHRSLPAGGYDLSLVTEDDIELAEGETIADHTVINATDNALIKNYSSDDDGETGLFDVDEVVVIEDYVTIVTAGRDQDDSTFTTTLEVTIGADTMKAGSNDIALDVPAYISGGYTMLPVRAVAEALSSAAIVKWDDATKTVTIFFGQRVISMTIGSKVMVVNGVDITMSAAPEITNGRTFLPLRDLGYALGLNEDKISWDDTTKTAKLN